MHYRWGFWQMRYLNSGMIGALAAASALIGGGAAAQQHGPVGVPSIALPGGEAPPPANLPHATGPSATSGSAANARFDEVGYAGVDAAMSGITVAVAARDPGHFVEITALDTGKIIVAATATSSTPAGRLASLSPRAAATLGIAVDKPTPVRIREIQPQAGDQAALRRGEPASARLSAPASLLTGLRARLSAVTKPASVAAPKPAPSPAATAAKTPKPAPTQSAQAKPKPAPAKPAAAKPAPAEKPAAKGAYHVQVASFSSEANARKLAARIDGHVEAAGKYWRVVLGPFATNAAAQQARDAVAKRGYGDARVRKD